MEYMGDASLRQDQEDDEAAFLTSRLAMRSDSVGEQRLPGPTYTGEYLGNGVGPNSGSDPSSPPYGEGQDMFGHQYPSGDVAHVEEALEENVVAGIGVADNEEYEHLHSGDDESVDAYEVSDAEVEYGDGGQVSSTAVDGKPTFALSRVRDLLKFHSESSIIARDATILTAEAVVLILQDLTRMAASQAERQHRKTIKYADIASVVHYFDRFSFLTDVIPREPSTTSGVARPIDGTRDAAVVESQSSRRGVRAIDEQQNRLRSNVSSSNRMRQAKLCFGNTPDCL
ncbi:hypothetical protein TRVL_01100 [Trypanosoma vivax]|uniref:Transcription factor CBF/NF-Y/archaeal histone domain-containing protein n=1 Tax=Trypanosoma vivax (strain Y486) TaxID=1055687 RepID=G0TUB1_TRYVY|nr:hypothetical protein TRVL_01100 [Trypanosoma vivax]CCC47545.1 conserved hypothetical protein [Trypanosoma vivax Y486]